MATPTTTVSRGCLQPMPNTCPKNAPAKRGRQIHVDRPKLSQGVRTNTMAVNETVPRLIKGVVAHSVTGSPKRSPARIL